MFGPEVKQIRQALGLTQAALAQLLPASTRTIIRWEQGHNHPSRLAENRIREVEADLANAKTLLRAH